MSLKMILKEEVVSGFPSTEILRLLFSETLHHVFRCPFNDIWKERTASMIRENSSPSKQTSNRDYCPPNRLQTSVRLRGVFLSSEGATVHDELLLLLRLLSNGPDPAIFASI
jgi:hypothetical protein